MSSLDLRSLEIFRAVAETGSATGAAALLHTTQPSITRAIAEFERLCGFVLFERLRLGMRLTAEGKFLLEIVRQNFEGLVSVQNAIASIRNGEAGSLEASAMPAVAESLLADIIGGFMRENPQVQLKLNVVGPAQIYNGLVTDQTDFGVAIGPLPHGLAIDRLRIGRSRMMLAVRKGHRLARARSVDFSVVGGRALTQLPAPHNIRAAVDMMILNTGIRPAIIHDIGTQRAAIRLVESADCLAFVDSHVGAELDGKRLVAIPFEPEVAWDIDIIYRRDRRHSKAFAGFLAFVKHGLQAPEGRRPWRSLDPKSLTGGRHLLNPERRRQKAAAR